MLKSTGEWNGIRVEVSALVSGAMHHALEISMGYNKDSWSDYCNTQS
jgi:hypothetical protein